MATTGKELESTVARLCAMSRAVGIHLVLATQRPSIDVITGLIKANIPTRIAFMVASKMDSRIIIDQVGAEKLLGKGTCSTQRDDPFPVRIQGAHRLRRGGGTRRGARQDGSESPNTTREIFVEADEDSHRSIRKSFRRRGSSYEKRRDRAARGKGSPPTFSETQDRIQPAARLVEI
jgi:S-DNA-T family DNA segregation ATPase FtsK/SpoIIIE